MQSILLICVLVQSPNMGEHLRGMEARLESLQNVTVDFDETTSTTPIDEIVEEFGVANADAPAVAANGNPVSLVTFGMLDERRNAIFRFANGNVRYEDVGSKRTFVAESFLSDRHEMLYQWPQGTQPNYQGYIQQSGKQDLPADSVIDYALGLRFICANSWLAPKSLMPKNMVFNRDNGLLQVRFVDPERARYSHVCIVDPSHGYRLQSYDLIAHGVGGGTRKGDFVVKELRNLSFANVQGVDLPEHVEFRSYLPADNETGRHQTQEVHLHVRQYRLNDPSNSKEGLRIVWPVGTMVTDQRTGTPIEIASRAQALDDETLAKLASGDSEPEPTQSFSPRIAIAGTSLLAMFVAIALGIYWKRSKRESI